MRNRLVPRSEWINFFGEFNRHHEGRPVAVTVLSPGFGSQIEANDLPFEGIVAPVEEGPISIHVGSRPERHVEHEIRDPRQVWVEMDENGVEKALDVESSDGTKTILEFLEASGGARPTSAAGPPRPGG